MAILLPPGWIQALSTHTAAQMRMYLASLQAGMFSSATSLRARGGVHPGFGQELVVTQAGSPNMTVLAESGACSIPGSENANQGNYFVVNDAQVTLSISAAHASLARIDIVVVNVRDAQYSGASNDAQLQVVAGTPASSPVAPTAPDNSITIAQIAVGAGVTSITNANITDTRRYIAAVGGVIPATNDAARPASTEINESQLVWSRDVDKLYIWDGAAYNQIFPGVAKISENVLVGTSASVTFSSIPSTYRNLRLYIVCRSDNASTNVNLLVRFNGDTAANYDYQELAGQQAVVVAVEQLAQTSIPMREMTGSTSPASHPGIFTIDIPWYAGTTFFKTTINQSSWSNGTATGTLVIRNAMGRWRSASAITSITLLPAAGNFISGSSFSLYGIP